MLRRRMFACRCRVRRVAPRRLTLLVLAGLVSCVSAATNASATGGVPTPTTATFSGAGGRASAPSWTPTTRSHANRDGSVTVRVYDHPVNYEDASGTWMPIDDRLIASSSPGFAYQNASNAFAVRFADHVAGTFNEFEVGGETYGLSLLGDQGALAVAPAAEVDSAAGEIVYPAVAVDTNLAYRLTAVGVKEDVVLESAQAPSSYSFLLKTPSGQQLSPRKLADGGWGFFAPAGNDPVFSFAPPRVRESVRHIALKACSRAVPCSGGTRTAKPPTPPAATNHLFADDGSAAERDDPGVGTVDVTAVDAASGSTSRLIPLGCTRVRVSSRL